MILYDLVCRKDHAFEAWFHSAPVFAAQRASGDIACPVCGSSEILVAPKDARNNSLSGPYLTEEGEEQLASDLIQALERLCRSIDGDEAEAGVEEGERFGGDSRAIRRTFGPSDRNTLRDEGIEVIRVPWVRRRHNS